MLSMLPGCSRARLLCPWFLPSTSRRLHGSAWGHYCALFGARQVQRCNTLLAPRLRRRRRCRCRLPRRSNGQMLCPWNVAAAAAAAAVFRSKLLPGWFVLSLLVRLLYRIFARRRRRRCCANPGLLGLFRLRTGDGQCARGNWSIFQRAVLPRLVSRFCARAGGTPSLI